MSGPTRCQVAGVAVLSPNLNYLTELEKFVLATSGDYQRPSA